MKKHKKLKIAGYADGGRPHPDMLGVGMAAGAGHLLDGRGRQVAAAIESATGAASAPSAVAPPVAGGLSGIRDGAIPPARFRIAQRRGMAYGMADGGTKRGNAGQIEYGNGGAVKGPGGSIGDRVGPVMLSNEEYVLPGDTVKAMGGAAALDALRAATHAFVDPGKRPAIARMANGGSVIEEISLGRSRADRAAIDDAVKRGQRPPGVARNPAYTPNLDRVSTQVQNAARATKPGVTAGAARLAAVPAGVAFSVADATKEDSTARYAQRFGLEEPTGDGSAGDLGKFAALRGLGFASDLANNLTLGAAGNFYRDKPDGLLQFNQPEGGAPAGGAPATGAAGVPTGRPQPRIAQGAVGTTQAQGATQGATQPGTINVTRQPNGVLSFSGSGDVSGGYSGAASGQLRGGGSSGAVAPEDYQAAVARAASDKASLSSLAIANLNSGTADGLDRAYRLASGDPEATAALENARQRQSLRQAALRGNNNAASILNNQAANATNLEATGLKIAADSRPKPDSAYDQERARGQKIDNDRAQGLSALVNQYLTAGDEKTRSAALERLNALNGGKDSADKYILVDIPTGAVDRLGNPVIAKMPFNTRTGQVVNTSSGAGVGPSALGDELPEGTKGKDRVSGKAYVIKNGQPVLVE